MSHRYSLKNMRPILSNSPTFWRVVEEIWDVNPAELLSHANGTEFRRYFEGTMIQLVHKASCKLNLEVPFETITGAEALVAIFWEIHDCCEDSIEICNRFTDMVSYFARRAHRYSSNSVKTEWERNEFAFYRANAVCGYSWR